MEKFWIENNVLDPMRKIEFNIKIVLGGCVQNEHKLYK